MKRRPILLIALPLALGAAAVWIWSGQNPVRRAIVEWCYPGSTAKVAAASASAEAPPHQHHAVAPPTPEAIAASVSAGPGPARVTSSVAPGTPLVRTEATPTSARLEASPMAPEVAISRADAQIEARTELEGVRFMLRDFRVRMGENPVGSNAEIMRAVMGANSAQANLGPPAGQTLNAEGELVDRWGTPYFFHQLAKDSMEIRSAGPDRRMWTSDDVITK